MSKIAVMNFSGNAGKSTISRHLLAPRMNNATVIPIESINSDGDGSDDIAIRGRQFADLMEALAVMENAVVDVGASNVEDFIGQMKDYHGSHEDFDYFVVPTVPKRKQIRDTIATIDTLHEIGVPADKIRVVFNMVERDEDVERAFSGLFDFHKDTKSFTLRPGAVIQVSEIFGKIGNVSIKEILNDPTELKAELQAANDPDIKVAISRRIAIKRLAVGVNQELDAVHKTLFVNK